MHFITDESPDFWTKDHFAPENEEIDDELEEEEERSARVARRMAMYAQASKTLQERYHREPLDTRPESPYYQVKSPRHLFRSNEAEQLFPQNSLILLAGMPKIGKTTLALALAKAITQGKPFAGLHTAQQPVGYISFDDSPNEILTAINRHPELTEDSPLFLSTNHEPIDTRQGLMQIEDFLLQHRDATVIVDSFHAAIKDTRTSDARAMRKLLTPLKRISERAGRIIIIHHTNAHGTRIADHVQLQAAVSQSILMSFKQHEYGRIIKWQCQGRGNHSTRTLYLKSIHETDFRAHNPNPYEQLNPLDKSTVPILNSLEPKPLTRLEIQLKTGLTERRVQKRVRALLNLGHVRKVERCGSPCRYSLAS